MIRVIGLGDTHCGAFGGLTPPAWIVKKERAPETNELQREMWNHYTRLVRTRSRVPAGGRLVVVCNGDAVDGPKNPSECITPDRLEQCRMAKACLTPWGAEKYLFTYGTPFHTGKEEPWEKHLADSIGGEIKSLQYLDAEGLILSFRHKLSRSAVPYGRHTAPARAHLWNQLNRLRGREPHVNILCFSHVHYHIGSFGKNWMAMTLPALQTTSGFGARECDGEVDWGIVYFDIEAGRIVEWGADIVELENMQAKVCTL